MYYTLQQIATEDRREADRRWECEHGHEHIHER